MSLTLIDSFVRYDIIPSPEDSTWEGLESFRYNGEVFLRSPDAKPAITARLTEVSEDLQLDAAAVCREHEAKPRLDLGSGFADYFFIHTGLHTCFTYLISPCPC